MMSMSGKQLNMQRRKGPKAAFPVSTVGETVRERWSAKDVLMRSFGST